MRFICLVVAVSLVFLAACKSSERTASGNTATVVPESENKPSKPPVREVYNPSETRTHDLLHTRLDVRFDWDKQHCIGKAELTLHPYFYATDQLELDARGFDLHRVALMKGDERHDLVYDYDGEVISIGLDKTYARTDTFRIFIDYTAKPNELEEGGSAAITSDKGLYFINPDGTEDKPQQIWTQGETQSSSCWFPTIDSPNERMTQEVNITVQQRFKTVSNGLLNFSSDNGNGTRTDYWRQDLPHAPYLVMMAIGEFAVVSDTWRDSIAVNYYVEPEYEADARSIFPNTPEMLEFFSTRLGVDYAWDKYSQIVVREYVSGAMENTSAVIFGEFAQQTTRECIDGDYEDVVSHELFHHWFGDLVTCESWANLPLNESFATYGEYLWREYKYGRDAADYHIAGDLRNYLQESRYKQADLIRYDYSDKEKMFDSHSYQKGGRVLHMLRKYVGDDAFFKSLQRYLEDNRFEAVEIHNLRLAFEAVTGEDLNWFFDQWFLSSGHPTLNVKHEYIDSLRAVRITVQQQQEFENTPVYRLPVDVDIYHAGQAQRHRIDITKVDQSFLLACNSRPQVVIFDAENMLLGIVNHNNTTEEWIAQYQNSKLYVDRIDALTDIAPRARKHEQATKVLLSALNDPFWQIRQEAAENLEEIIATENEAVKAGLIKLATTDEKSSVRTSALRQLSIMFSDEDLLPIFRAALKDQSYAVMGQALSGIAKLNQREAMQLAKPLEQEKSQRVLMNIAQLYAENGTDKEHTFFANSMDRFTGYSVIGYLRHYRDYLKGDRSMQVLNSGVENLGKVFANGPNYFSEVVARQALEDIRAVISQRQHKLAQEITALESKDMTDSTLIDLRKQQQDWQNLDSKIAAVLVSGKKD